MKDFIESWNNRERKFLVSKAGKDRYQEVKATSHEIAFRLVSNWYGASAILEVVDTLTKEKKRFTRQLDGVGNVVSVREVSAV